MEININTGNLVMLNTHSTVSHSTYLLPTFYNNQTNTLLDINLQCTEVTGPASPFPLPRSSALKQFTLFLPLGPTEQSRHVPGINLRIPPRWQQR